MKLQTAGPTTGLEPSARKHPVVEIFGPTIQGEGPRIGQKVMFVRFGLCDFRCARCDSMHAVDADSVRKRAKWLTWSEIVSLLREYHCYCDWVVLSGGNPLIHELSGLVDDLHLDRWKVAVETQGSYYRNWVRACDFIVISPKGPGMGERCDLHVLDHFVSHVSNCNTAFKIVIFGSEDLEFAYSIKRRYTWAPLPMYLSVGHKVETNEGVTELLGRYRWIIETVARDSAWTDVHILPQMHVLLWGNELGR